MADGFWARLQRGLWREQHSADWKSLVAVDGDAIMAAGGRDRFHAKQGRSITRWVLRSEPRLAVYIKRHHCASRWAGFLATLWPWKHFSAAWHEADSLKWARAHRFRVPNIVAVGEKVGPWGRLQGYLALEELSGMLALHEAIPRAAQMLPAAAFQAWKRHLIRALAQIVARLHAMRRFHKDLYLCHFFVPETYQRGGASIGKSPMSADAIAMIDLHRFAHHPLTAAWWRLKDLAQLLYSSNVPGVTARDRVRFARLYAGARRHSLAWRWTRWAVGVRWRNYRRHNEPRKLSRAA